MWERWVPNDALIIAISRYVWGPLENECCSKLKCCPDVNWERQDCYGANTDLYLRREIIKRRVQTAETYNQNVFTFVQGQNHKWRTKDDLRKKDFCFHLKVLPWRVTRLQGEEDLAKKKCIPSNSRSKICLMCDLWFFCRFLAKDSISDKEHLVWNIWKKYCVEDSGLKIWGAEITLRI